MPQNRQLYRAGAVSNLLFVSLVPYRAIMTASLLDLYCFGFLPNCNNVSDGDEEEANGSFPIHAVRIGSIHFPLHWNLYVEEGRGKHGGKSRHDLSLTLPP